MTITDNMLPLVTVITVVRNSPNELELTVKSVLEQTYAKVEYIIVDGASIDETINIIRGHEKHLHSWISEEDDGIYDAMNKGAALAKGEWVVFMNAGDVFFNSKSLENISNELTSDASVIIAGVEEVLVDELEERRFIRFPKPIEDIWRNLPTSHQSILVRKEIQQAYRFDTSYEWCADQDLICRLYDEGVKFITTDQIFCRFDCSGGLSRDPILFVEERWRISHGRASLLRRILIFGREYLCLRFLNPIIRFTKSLLPRELIIRIRRFRGL